MFSILDHCLFELPGNILKLISFHFLEMWVWLTKEYTFVGRQTKADIMKRLYGWSFTVRNLFSMI